MERAIPQMNWDNERILSRTLALLEQKPRFDIEASLACNLACVMCPRDQITRPVKVMSRALMDRLVDWLPRSAEIYFCGIGEPTLNKHLCQIIERIVNEQRTVGITTNAMTLDRDLSARLIGAGIDFIQVSFNSLKPDTYRAIMVGADPELIFENLDHLARIKPQHLRVELAFTEQEQNMDETEAVQVFARERGFEVQHNLLHARGGHYSHDYRATSRNEMMGCGIFARRHFISCTGNLLACCHDLGASTRLGNIAEMSFEELLAVKRRRVLDNHWFSICRPCDDINRITDLEAVE